jgi:Tfp pilus assembly protein PilF
MSFSGHRRTVKWVIATAVVAASVSSAFAAPPAVGTKPPTAVTAAGAPAGAKNNKASLEALLQQGSDALAAGQYQAAREAFLDVIAIDPRNAKAHHGAALCLMATKEIAKAAGLFDKAFGLTTTPDRAMVLNAAACHMATGGHMRAAKLIKDYLTVHTKEQDEPMVNALGTALSAATNAERKNRFFSECTAFYVIANQRLETARPGYKRFGAEWMPAKDAASKEAALKAQQKQLDQLSDAIATAEDRLSVAAKEYEHQKFLITRGETPGNYYYERAERAYDAAKSAVQVAQDRYDSLASSIAQPAFPAEISVVAMDNLTPPPVSTAIAAATNDNTTIPEVKPKPRPRPVRPKPTDTATATPTPEPPPAIALEPPKSNRKVRITQYAAAFPVAPDLVVTSAAIIEDGATLQVQGADGQGLAAELVRKDAATGLAMLRITGRKLNPLALADSFNGGQITCASFPSVDLFTPSAQGIPGTATAPKEGWTVQLNVHPRLAGAPLCSGGKVVGVCVAPRDAERAKLPAITLDQLKAFLGSDVTPPAKAGDPTASLLQLVTTRETGGE